MNPHVTEYCRNAKGEVREVRTLLPLPDAFQRLAEGGSALVLELRTGVKVYERPFERLKLYQESTVSIRREAKGEYIPVNTPLGRYHCQMHTSSGNGSEAAVLALHSRNLEELVRDWDARLDLVLAEIQPDTTKGAD